MLPRKALEFIEEDSKRSHHWTEIVLRGGVLPGLAIGFVIRLFSGQSWLQSFAEGFLWWVQIAGIWIVGYVALFILSARIADSSSGGFASTNEGPSHE